jgi:Tfp pilus assembly protein PilE
MASEGQGGAITSVEAFVLAVMAMILVAIAVPSYVTIRDRQNDAAARDELREAVHALETRPAAARRTSCLQRTVGGRTWRLTLPEQAIERGGCP